MTILLICLKIFFARIVDVCLGTFRTVCVVKGKRTTSAVIAFFEVFIWYLVAREALNPGINTIFIPIAYAGGFATGTYLGILLSSLFIGGHLTLNVISSKIKQTDVTELKKHGYGVSVLNTTDNKTMLLIEIDKKRLNDINKIIKELDPDAFIIVNETKYVHNGFIK